MPKKNLLISAALTAFILVIATGIASAYQSVSATLESIKTEATAAARTEEEGLQQEEQLVFNPVPTEEIQVSLTHQEAALVAANFLEQTDLYSVENVVWEETDAYKVVFSTGDIVYVSMNGDILATESPETVIVTETTNTNTRPSNNNTYDDDHDDDHDDDDHDDDDHDDDHEEHDDD